MSKILVFIDKTKEKITKNAPEILTGVGIASMIVSTVLAVKATPKANSILEDAKDRIGRQLDLKETIGLTWKLYIPSVLSAVSGIMCIIGANSIKNKRYAAVSTAYNLSERAFSRYRAKLIEQIGERSEQNLRQSISQEEVKNNPPKENQIIITQKGNTLCMDSISGRYFKSDIDSIRKIINELNRKMTYDNYISLEEFYIELGLSATKDSDLLGWSIENGLIDIRLDACLTPDEEPCILLDYNIMPKYNFNR